MTKEIQSRLRLPEFPVPEAKLSANMQTPAKQTLAPALGPLSSFLVGSGLPCPTHRHFQALLCQHPRPGPQ